MGKKSRKNNGATPTPPSEGDIATCMDTTSTSTSAAAAAAVSTPAPAIPIYYPSDGPSDVELLQTTSLSLQAKLDQLTQLGLANDRAGFVQQFVPLELSPQDMNGYLQDLTTAPEAEGQWRNLISEIAAIRGGRGVDRIEGDQITKAVFYFSHPLLEQCDREVSFVCTSSTNGGEWRAEG
jgi:hypothetical protein